MAKKIVNVELTGPVADLFSIYLFLYAGNGPSRPAALKLISDALYDLAPGMDGALERYARDRDISLAELKKQILESGEQDTASVEQ